MKVTAQSDLPHHNAEAGIETERWRRLAELALTAEDISEGELTLFFIDEQIMTDLNAEHMGETGPTDVLAFPIDGPTQGTAKTTIDPEGPPKILGDIFICPSIARKNAGIYKKPFEDEIALLVIHGVLHVLGHDHAEDEEKRIMQEREKVLLADHYQP